MHLFYAKRHPPAFTGGCLRISGCALQSLLDLGCDLVGGEAVLPQHILGLAGLAEAVVDADLAEFTVHLAHEDVCHGIAQTADDAVFLHRHHVAALLCVLRDAGGVDGFDGVNVDDRDLDTL